MLVTKMRKTELWSLPEIAEARGPRLEALVPVYREGKRGGGGG